MQSFTFFVPFNSSFWNCSYGSVSQLFYLLCIKFIEKKKKTTPLHDDDNKNSIVVTLLLSCLRCIINIHQVLLESASLVPLFNFFNLMSIFHLFSVWLFMDFILWKKIEMLVKFSVFKPTVSCLILTNDEAIVGLHPIDKVYLNDNNYWYVL